MGIDRYHIVTFFMTNTVRQYVLITQLMNITNFCHHIFDVIP